MDVQARHLPGDGLDGRGYIATRKILGLQGGYGRGKLPFLKRAVSDDDDIFQHFTALVQHHVQPGKVPRRDLLAGKSQTLQDQDGSGGQIPVLETAVEIGDFAVIRAAAPDRHHDAGKRLPGLVGDAALQRPLLLPGVQ